MTTYGASVTEGAFLFDGDPDHRKWRSGSSNTLRIAWFSAKWTVPYDLRVNADALLSLVTARDSFFVLFLLFLGLIASCFRTNL
jgi:hypothetical protein